MHIRNDWQAICTDVFLILMVPSTPAHFIQFINKRLIIKPFTRCFTMHLQAPQKQEEMEAHPCRLDQDHFPQNEHQWLWAPRDDGSSGKY